MPARPAARRRSAPAAAPSIDRAAARGRRRPRGVDPARAAEPSATDDKRTAILGAALLLFGRYGYRRTSIDDLARETGIAKGTVYLYFATKEEIFRALCDTVMARVLADAERAAATAAPLTARLRSILAAKFDYFHELLHGSPHAGELLDSGNRVSADVFRQADRAYLRIVERTIATAAVRGELARARARLSAAAAADLLVASAHGADADVGAATSPRVYRRRLDDLVDAIVIALGGATVR